MVAGVMTEAAWQGRVVDAAKLFRWRVYHTRAAMTAKGFRVPVTSEGFPDLLLLRGPRLVVAELKVGTAVRPEQQAWLDDLAQVPGVEAFVWLPKHWDEVLEKLR